MRQVVAQIQLISMHLLIVVMLITVICSNLIQIEAKTNTPL